MKTYTASAVLQGWREWLGFRATLPKQDLSRSSNPSPAMSRFPKFLRVEAFFKERFDLHHLKPLVLLGTPCPEFELAWEAWYRQHPLARIDVEQELHQIPVYTLREAVELVAAELKTEILYDSARKAAIAGKLDAWCPDGRWHTRLDCVRFWFKEVKRDRSAA